MIKKNIYLILAVLSLIFASLIFYNLSRRSDKIYSAQKGTANRQINSSAADNETVNNKDSAAETVSGPSIKISPEFYDFGTVIYGEVAEYNFLIENLGDAPLEILRLSTSCGCTKAFIDEDKKIIAPQTSAEILVTFDPAVHKDDTDLGELIRIVYIKSNDPLRPEAEIELKANVIKK